MILRSFLLMIIVDNCISNPFNVKKCCDDLCGENDLIIKEHCVDCYDINHLVLEDEEVQMTCFPCQEDDEYDLEFRWNFNKTNVNLDTIKFKNVFEDDVMGSQVSFPASGFNETGLISCSLFGTNRIIRRNYFVCTKIPEPELFCVVFPTDNGSIALNCSIGILNFTMKNSEICNYSFTSMDLYNWDTGLMLWSYSDINCFPICHLATLYPMKFSNENTDLPVLSITVNAVSNIQNSNYHLKLPSYESIYYDTAIPQLLDIPLYSSCYFILNSYVPTIIVDPNPVELYCLVEVKDDNNVSIPTLVFNLSNYDANLLDSTNHYLHLIGVDNLEANRNYSMEITTRLLSSQYKSGPFVLECQTINSSPQYAVQFSLGSYLKIDHNRYRVFWKATPSQNFYGSDFKYVIRYGNKIHDTKNCSIDIKTKKMSAINIEINSQNEVGFGPIWKKYELYPELKTVKNISVISSYIYNSTYIVQWNPFPNATSYVVFWCSTNRWRNCNGNIEWKKASKNKPFMEIWNISTTSQYVFGVSACYEEKCSEMKQASMHTIFSMNHAHCWFMPFLKNFPFFRRICKV